VRRAQFSHHSVRDAGQWRQLCERFLAYHGLFVAFYAACGMSPGGCGRVSLGHELSFHISAMSFPACAAGVLAPGHGCDERFKGWLESQTLAAMFHQAVEGYVLRDVLRVISAHQSPRESIRQATHPIDQLSLFAWFVRVLDVHVLLSERGCVESGIAELPLHIFQQSAF
jgi:hypothetical protein